MSKKNARRLVAGASTAALAVGFAASFGVGAASAAPVSQSTTSGSWTFNRTISNGTPAPGETITVTNNIRWNGGLAPTISALRDIHPACLAYVANSSRVEGSGVGTTTPDTTTVSMNGSWIRSAVNRDISYSVQYTVGANCARDAALTTGAAVSANQGLSTTHATAGPSVTIAKTASTTTVAVSPAPQAGAATTLTATVTGGATGTVEFADNGTVLGTGTVDNGTATYIWTPSAAQPYSITAKYLGDATHAQSTSAPQTGTVTPAPTAPGAPTNLAANPATVTAGGTVTITGKADADTDITVTAGSKTCTTTADNNGNFACDITTDTAGTLTVTAVAANNIGTSPASAPITVDVTTTATTTDLTVAPAPQVDAPTTLTATVTGGATGTVEFADNGTVLGTGTVDNGTATYIWTPSAAQPYSITAKYLGDATHAQSTSAPQTGTVTPAPTAPGAPTNLAANPATVTAGGTVTITGKADAGTDITVTAGSKTCTTTADNNGNFACDITTDTAGTLTVTAVAANNIGTSPASAPITVDVTPAPTAPGAPTNLAANPATVTAGGTVTITGKADAGTDITVTAGSKTCTTTADNNGNFACDITTDTAGTLTVTAVAANNIGTSPASAPITVDVTPAPTAPGAPTNLAANPATVTAGGTVTITGKADAGTDITVTAGSKTCTTTADNNGNFACDITTDTAGALTVTAVAANNIGTSPASAPITVDVTPAPTAPGAPTNLAANPATVTAGGTVTITGKADADTDITVTAGSKTCTTTADNNGNFACDIVTDTAGTLTVTAVAANNIGTSPASAPITVDVTPAPTAPGAPTNLAADPATVTAGGTVTITGKADAGTDITVTAGSKTCTTTADNNGNFACDIVTDTAGTLTVTAVAANNVGTSPASTPITVDVTEVPSGSAVITVSPASLVAGTEATITVTGADAGTPVTVKVGTATVCTTTVAENGTATCQWIPAEGGQTLTAEVVVDGTAITVTKNVTVAPADNPGGGGSVANLFAS